MYVFIIGFGFGIVYVGFLFLLYFTIEFRDILVHGVEAESQVFKMALEFTEGVLHAGIFLLFFGGLFVLLGWGYKVAVNRERYCKVE